jgi:hypothetical protein
MTKGTLVIAPIYDMFFILTAWLALYAGVGHRAAGTFLKAVQLILKTTLQLIYLALKQGGFEIEVPSSLDIPIPVDL